MRQVTAFLAAFAAPPIRRDSHRRTYLLDFQLCRAVLRLDAMQSVLG